jgi:hypothetical protein
MNITKFGMIYTDYDGVCCNFIKGAESRLGHSITGKDWEDMDPSRRNALFANACDSVAFWADLEPMPDFSIYWSYVKYWNPGVLTAAPQWSKDGYQYAERGKAMWNRRHTKVPDSRFHVVKRSDKKNFAMLSGKPNILIDDHHQNCEDWEHKGGTAILHTNAVSTIIQLKRLGFTK